jgi:hypothetical protein
MGFNVTSQARSGLIDNGFKHESQGPRSYIRCQISVMAWLAVSAAPGGAGKQRAGQTQSR